MPEPSFNVRRATPEDYRAVACLAFQLLAELYDPEEYGYSVDSLAPVARHLLDEPGGYWALLACAADGQAVGVLTLNECSAIYAFGRFGEISELYISPQYRGLGLGARLIDAAVEFGRARGWSLIEVGAPQVPKWERTLNFYLRRGFAEVGPRLTRYI